MLNNKKNVLFIGANSDIATRLVPHFRNDNWTIFGTTRQKSERADFDHIYCLDINDSPHFYEQLEQLAQEIQKWNLIIFAAGSMLPIGKIFEQESDLIKKSFFLNSIAPIIILKHLWYKKVEDTRSNVIFFAGGGTNNSFDNYLCYALAKLSNIKMVELMASEYPEVGFFSLGTGYVKTKIHNETLAAGKAAGRNEKKTLEFLTGQGTAIDEIYSAITWCIRNSSSATGRNYSVKNDFDPKFRDKLLETIEMNIDAFKLRRHSNDWKG